MLFPVIPAFLWQPNRDARRAATLVLSPSRIAANSMPLGLGFAEPDRSSFSRPALLTNIHSHCQLLERQPIAVVQPPATFAVPRHARGVPTKNSVGRPLAKVNGTPCPLRPGSNLGSRASFHRKLDVASQTNARLAAFSPKRWEVFVDQAALRV